MVEILLALTAALGILSGYLKEPKVQTVTVVEYKTKVVVPPDELLIGCELPEPPDENKYIESSLFTKEEMLIKNITEHQRAIIVCDSRLKKLKDWKVQQLAIETQ